MNKNRSVKARYVPKSRTGGTLGRHWVLPATPERYDAMVEQTAKAAFMQHQKMISAAKCPTAKWSDLCENRREDLNWYPNAREALAALGITRPAKTRK